jgi:putative ABC transport system permease protein
LGIVGPAATISTWAIDDMQTRRVPLAWRNLVHSWRRLAVALGGIAFAVVLVFMETGFENALFDSTVKVIDVLDADILLVNKAQHSLTAARPFSRRRLAQAGRCPGVRGAYPLYIESYDADFKPPGGRRHPIRVLAYHPGDPVFQMPDVVAQAAALAEPGAVLADVLSKPKYGIPDSAAEMARFAGAELARQAVRLVGTFSLGTDFANDGNLLTSAANFARFFPRHAGGGDPLAAVDLGVVQLESGADPDLVMRQLRAVLPDDLTVLTKAEMIDREIRFWRTSTPVGYIFAVGTIMGFVVGVVICYQIMYSDVADHMPQFATLRAMGYDGRFLIGVVLRQSLYLAVLGFLPGLIISLACYQALAQYTGLLMVLSVKRAAAVLALTVAMCLLSGLMAIRKLLSADPAELF